MTPAKQPFMAQHFFFDRAEVLKQLVALEPYRLQIHNESTIYDYDLSTLKLRYLLSSNRE